MTVEDAGALISAYLDGELDPTQEDILRRRLDEEPELAALYDRMCRVGERTRSFFDEEEGRISDLDQSRETFIRTSLVVPRGRTRRRLRLSVMVAVVGLVSLLVVVAVVWQASWTDRDRLAAAAKATLQSERLLTVTIHRTPLLGPPLPPLSYRWSRQRWVLDTRDATFRVPGGLWGGDTPPPVILQGQRFVMGSDGGTVWLWVDGKPLVHEVSASAAAPGSILLRSILEGDLAASETGPLQPFERAWSVMESLASGSFRFKRHGVDSVGGERVFGFDVAAGETERTRVWLRERDGSLRRLERGLLTVDLEESPEPADPAMFTWQSYAPEGARVVSPR
jgi:hypothetical protein